ncbi:MAG: tetratricopeptide repeat protein [Gemmatimonadota bacterium]
MHGRPPAGVIASRVGPSRASGGVRHPARRTGRRRACQAHRLSFLPRALLLAATLVVGGSARLAVAQIPARPSQESQALALATRLERAGRLSEARRVVEDLLKSQPASVPALVMLMQIAAMQGEPEAVLPFVEQAVGSGRGNDPGVRQLWVRALSEAGRADSAEAVARRWAEEAPDRLTAYPELASVLWRQGKRDEAIDVLLAGRSRSGDPTVFAQELAVLYLEAGAYDAAAGEWVTVLGWGESGVATVAGRLEERGPGRELALTALWLRLLEPRVPFTAARAGIDLALRLGEGERAHTLLAWLARRAPPDARIPLLRDYALRARNLGYTAIAGWAATRLAREAETAEERRHWRAMAADLTLRVGDTAAARASFEAVIAGADPGTEAHRIAARHLFSLQAATDPARAERILEEYALSYPEEELEAARMAVELSRGYVRRGDLAAAERALGLGPAAPTDAVAAALLAGQRAKLMLYRERPGAALSHLETAVFSPTGRPEDRTEAIALLDALTRADSAEAAYFGRLLLATAVDPGSVPRVEKLLSGWRGLPVSKARPALLALAAGELERVDRHAEAASLLTALVEEFPEAPEVPPALLALARSAVPSRPGEARRWLERLIIDHPTSALTPVARRLLAELNGQVPGS